MNSVSKSQIFIWKSDIADLEVEDGPTQLNVLNNFEIMCIKIKWAFWFLIKYMILFSQETSEVTEMESIKEEVESQASNNSSQPSTPTKDCSQSDNT